MGLSCRASGLEGLRVLSFSTNPLNKNNSLGLGLLPETRGSGTAEWTARHLPGIFNAESANKKMVEASFGRGFTKQRLSSGLQTILRSWIGMSRALVWDLVGLEMPRHPMSYS